MKIIKNAAFVAAASLCVATTASAAPVFLDTFDIPDDTSPNPNTNVNLNVPARQSGDVFSTYTEEFLGTGNDALVQANSTQFGDNDVLLLRTTRNVATAQRAGVQLDTNFAQLIDTAYTISFDFVVTTTTGASTDLWLGFGLGGTTDLSFPTTSADYGFLVRPTNGNSTQYNDGVATQSATALTPSPGTGNNQVGSVSVLIDETGATPTATLTYSSAGGSITLPEFSFDFGVEDVGRYFEIVAHQGGGTTGALADYRIDNLAITAVPEPTAVAGLAGLAALGLRRRRN